MYLVVVVLLLFSSIQFSFCFTSEIGSRQSYSKITLELKTEPKPPLRFLKRAGEYLQTVDYYWLLGVSVC